MYIIWKAWDEEKEFVALINYVDNFDTIDTRHLLGIPAQERVVNENVFIKITKVRKMCYAVKELSSSSHTQLE